MRSFSVSYTHLKRYYQSVSKLFNVHCLNCTELYINIILQSFLVKQYLLIFCESNPITCKIVLNIIQYCRIFSFLEVEAERKTEQINKARKETMMKLCKYVHPYPVRAIELYGNDEWYKPCLLYTSRCV